MVRKHVTHRCGGISSVMEFTILIDDLCGIDAVKMFLKLVY